MHLRKSSTALLLLTFAFVAGAQEKPVDRLSKVLDAIDEHYLREIPREELTTNAIRAMVKELDPYSRYLTPAEHADFKQTLAAQFGGVGLTFAPDEATRQPRVRYLIRNGAAFAAGIMRDDLIVEIDGKPTAGIDADGVMVRLKGTPGTKVSLRVQRGDASHAYTLQRKVVEFPSVRGARVLDDGSWDYMQDAAKRIGYIRISAENDDTVGRVESALVELKKKGMKALILDLRDNVGGKFTAAVQVADFFLDAGPIVTVTAPQETKATEAKPGTMTDVPMVVLINAGTASSGEILAAALTESKRAITIGQRTFGKGYVQEIFDLGDEVGAVILTTAAYQGPSGKNFDTHYQKQLAEQARNGEPSPKKDEPVGGVAPSDGMEMIVEGEEYDTWSKDARLLDGPLVLQPSDLQNKPDRVLDRAVEILTEALAKRAAK